MMLKINKSVLAVSARISEGARVGNLFLPVETEETSELRALL